MPHRITTVLDTIIVATAAITSAVSSLLLATAETPSAGELQMLLLPLLGAVFISGGMIMLNPAPETRTIVIGRSIVSLFCGTLGPQIIGTLHPALASLAVKPAVLVFAGGAIAGLAYVLSRPFTRELYARADAVAKREAQRLEERLAPAVETKTVTVVETKPASVPADRESGGV